MTKLKQSWIRPALVFLALTGIAAAQDEADPPSRVARLASITGQVSFEPATVDEWTAASLNYPLTTGDNLYTDTGSRAVLRVGRNSIRLNDGTNFQIVNLSDQVMQVSINSGSMSVRVRRLEQGETWEVDTPNGAITLAYEGEYRIDCDPTRNATMVTSHLGEADVTANNQSFPVHERETAYFGADGNPDVRDANAPDEFDEFAQSRDRIEDVPPPQYVSQDLDGYEDLNANGAWTSTSDYGPVWYPRVESGWAPYRSGRWAWVEPWGWSWVDDEPWGFAPFHYGRWAYVGNRWGWCPGPVSVRPVYAPHLVAFVGGGGFGVSLGVGGGDAVGWFPLGPRDPYIPSYHGSPAYIRNVNFSNTRVRNINITNVNVTNVNYMNRGVPGAVVAVPQRAFVSAQPVGRAALRVSANDLGRVQVVGMAPRVAPQRESVLVTAPGRRAMAPPANLVSRPVVARMAPPARAVSFQAKQQMLQQHPGQPVAPQQLQTLRREAPSMTAAPGRVAVRPINAAQVRPITPTVQQTPARGGFNGARPVQTAPGNVPNGAGNGQRFGQPAAVAPQPQRTQPATPNARPQAMPPAQSYPGRQNAAPGTQAPVNRAPATQAPAYQPAPQRPNQAQPTYREAPVRQQAEPQRQQVQPPVRQQAPPPQARPQAVPPQRPAVQPERQVQRPVPQTQRPAAEPQRQAPRSEPQRAAPAKDDRDKKQ